MAHRRQAVDPRVLALLVSTGAACNLFGPVERSLDEVADRDMSRDAMNGTDDTRDPADSTSLFDATVTNDASFPGDDTQTIAGADIGADAPPTGSWWDPAWGERVRIDVGGTQSGTEVAVPVPVILDPSRWNAAAARPDRLDVRFVGPDDATVLPAEREGTTDLFWVQVPSIGPAGTTIWMYYANPSAGATGSPTAVWDPGFVAVWHFDGLADSTANGNDFPNDGGTLPDAWLGPAAQFGDDIAIAVPNSASLQRPDTSITISAWIYHDEPQSGWVAIVSREYGTSFPDDLWFGLVGNELTIDYTPGSGCNTLAGPTVPVDTWTHVATTLDGSDRRLYIDGIQVANDVFSGAILHSPNPVRIGSDSNNAGVSLNDFFRGSIDEIRISESPRSAEWLRLEHLSMTDTLLAFGPTEP